MQNLILKQLNKIVSKLFTESFEITKHSKHFGKWNTERVRNAAS